MCGVVYLNLANLPVSDLSLLKDMKSLKTLVLDDIQGFVPLPPGATHVKTPKTRKSDWLVVRSDWMPACR